MKNIATTHCMVSQNEQLFEELFVPFESERSGCSLILFSALAFSVSDTVHFKKEKKTTIKSKFCIFDFRSLQISISLAS